MPMWNRKHNSAIVDGNKRERPRKIFAETSVMVVLRESADADRVPILARVDVPLDATATNVATRLLSATSTFARRKGIELLGFSESNAAKTHSAHDGCVLGCGC